MQVVVGERSVSLCRFCRRPRGPKSGVRLSLRNTEGVPSFTLIDLTFLSSTWRHKGHRKNPVSNLPNMSHVSSAMSTGITST